MIKFTTFYFTLPHPVKPTKLATGDGGGGGGGGGDGGGGGGGGTDTTVVVGT